MIKFSVTASVLKFLNQFSTKHFSVNISVIFCTVNLFYLDPIPSYRLTLLFPKVLIPNTDLKENNIIDLNGENWTKMP